MGPHCRALASAVANAGVYGGVLFGTVCVLVRTPVFARRSGVWPCAFLWRLRDTLAYCSPWGCRASESSVAVDIDSPDRQVLDDTSERILEARMRET